MKVKKLKKLLKSLPKDYDVQFGTLDKNVITIHPSKGFWIDKQDKVIVLIDYKQ